MSTKRDRAPKSTPAAVDGEYTPTPRDAKIATDMVERRKSARTIKLAVTDTAAQKVSVSVQHPDPAVGSMLLMHALGTVNEQFADAIVMQLCNAAATDGKVNDKKLNALLSMVTGIKPNDEIEAMLAAQMAAVHNATMNAALYLNNAGMLNQVESYTNGLNKLARTFAVQVEALKKHRSSGEQNIRVQHQHVNVAEGGQAIIGSVQAGGRGVSTEKERQPHEPRHAEPKALTYAPGTPMLSNVEALRPALQGAGDERLECLPLPRRLGRSA